MAGQIKKMIDSILQQRAGSNPAIVQTTKAKFILRGINPDKFTDSSPDDPVLIEKIKGLAKEFNVKI